MQSIAANLAAAQHAADLQDAQAAQDAENRRLQAALAAGGTGQYGGGVSDPVTAALGGGAPYAVGGLAAPPGGLSANDQQGVFGVDLGAMDYPDASAPPVESPFADPQVIQQIVSALAAPPQAPAPASIWDAVVAALAPPVSGYSAKSTASQLH